MDSILASVPSCPWFCFRHFQKNFDIAEVNRRDCCSESGQQGFNNVHQTYLERDGNLVLQKALSSEGQDQELQLPELLQHLNHVGLGHLDGTAQHAAVLEDLALKFEMRRHLFSISLK